MHYIIFLFFLFVLITVCLDYGWIKNEKTILLFQAKNLSLVLILVGVGILLYQSVLWLKMGVWHEILAYQLLPTDLEKELIDVLQSWEWRGLARVVIYLITIPAFLFVFISACIISCCFSDKK